MSKKKLPSKKIIMKDSNITVNTPGGSNKFFGEYTDETRDFIKKNFEDLLIYNEDIFQKNENIPVVSKIIMKDEAIAKSHKPIELCKYLPIVGGDDLNEVFIRVSKDGLDKTIERIEEPSSEQLKANMTAIKGITPIIPEDKITNLKRINNKTTEENDIKIKIKPFDFKNEFYNEQIIEFIKQELSKIDGVRDFKFHDISKSLKLYEVSLESMSLVDEISKINGIRSIDTFQEYYALINNKESDANSKLLDDIYNEKHDESDYIIGIIDSGISDENEYLQEYIIDRYSYVHKDYQNNGHGTFVASTIQYGNQLNNIESDTNIRFKFIDIPLLPNSDPNYGPVGDPVGELDFMEAVNDVLFRYHQKCKLWNMSLGTNTVISDTEISDLAIFIDDMQDKYNVQIILACGNYQEESVVNRTWPPTDSSLQSNEDRITSPADSIRSISVGSLAMRESEDSIVSENEPSPFSRKGPGPNFSVKPELVDYGGNLDIRKNILNIGVLGLDERGNIIENIGTSFSAPRITRKFAVIDDSLEEQNLLLSKALLMHSARIESHELLTQSDFINYYGFGMPSNNKIDIINSSESEVTLIFNQKISQSTHLQMWDFPYPESLIRDNKYYGEIAMTLVYNPIRDSDYNKEYCRTNIDASFGTYDETGVYNGQVPIVKTWEDKFEKAQVENGFKWSPIKSYYRSIPVGITEKEGWKLRVDLTPRHGLENIEQEFLLILTIKDPLANDIYSEIMNGLELQGYITNELTLRSQLRERN